MPALLHSLSNRRDFLKTISVGSTAIAMAGCATNSAAKSEKEFHVALLSDTHIPADVNNEFRKFKPVENFKRITPEVVAARPELAIICGDAARLEGTVDDYRQLSTLLQPINAVAPVCIALGNHDDRASFGMVFKAVAGEKQNINGKQVVVVEHETARLIVLDSLMYVNKVAGQLGKEQRKWLAEFLAKADDRPAIIFVHHTLKDGDGDLTDADRLFELIRPQRHVKAIFFGHSHAWSITQRDRVQLINLPAVAYNFSDNDPVGWVDARFRRSGVTLTMRAFAGNTADNGRTFEVKWV